jgi:light-regulated signal transduction histidine kinase (bacteriophytochrome)
MINSAKVKLELSFLAQHDGVRVLWEERTVSGVPQWLLSVQDTGPGFQWQSPAAPLERVLKHATQESHEVDVHAERRGDVTAHVDPAPTLRSQSHSHDAVPPAGEGIGLSIVKRLCELLDASLELETSPGTGTTFRVVFPRAYALPAAL